MPESASHFCSTRYNGRGVGTVSAAAQGEASCQLRETLSAHPGVKRGYGKVTAVGHTTLFTSSLASSKLFNHPSIFTKVCCKK